MSDKSKIEWCDATWNPTRGCTKISPGCKHCYAATFAERFRGVPGHPYEQGFDLRLVPDKLTEPLHWKKPRRVFVNSMSDLFHEDVPDEFIAAVFGVMALARRHTFQVLTKRADRMQKLLANPFFWNIAVPDAILRVVHDGPSIGRLTIDATKLLLPNIWLGVSVEDQQRADERIPHLLRTPASIRFLSCEPLLEAVDLTRLYGHISIGGSADLCVDALAGRYGAAWAGRDSRTDKPLAPLGAGRIGWVIVGGESGHGARPFDLAWARSILAQCKAAQVPVFLKQLGAHPKDEIEGPMGPGPLYLRLKDRAHGGDPAEWPEDLRVRQFPEERR